MTVFITNRRFQQTRRRALDNGMGQGSALPGQRPHEAALHQVADDDA
jgi:hypothetical protein